MKVLFTLIFCGFLITLTGQPSPSLVSFETGFSSPVDIANAGDGSDRIFIVEKAGVIKIIDKQGNIKTFLDINTQVGSNWERGLLGLAFHPDYVNNGYFYVNYTGTGSNNNFNTFISRFQVSTSNPDTAIVATEKKLITIPQPAGNHNAGDLEFGPDGYLYIPLGDGGPATCVSQEGNTLLGKALRIDVNQNINNSPWYGIPPDNPYISNGSILDEIWAWGFRNPWRFSFDRLTGDMWIADVGAGSWEEVDYISFPFTSGQNFGWLNKEGDHWRDSTACENNSSTPFSDPIFEYDHGQGSSITGGYVYRGCEYPNMQGYYICMDYNSSTLWTVLPNGDSTRLFNVGNSIVSFGEDEYGELYAASLSGTIYQVTDGSATTCDGCPINRAPGNISSDSTVQAANTVYGLGLINNSSTVSFKGDNIQLNPGFEVMLNAIFNAEGGDPCNN